MPLPVTVETVRLYWAEEHIHFPAAVESTARGPVPIRHPHPLAPTADSLKADARPFLPVIAFVR